MQKCRVDTEITSCVPLFRQMTFGSLSTSFIKEELAAADPMDVTQIIEEAKVKVQSGPRVRYVVKANLRPAKSIQPPAEEVGNRFLQTYRHHIFLLGSKWLQTVVCSKNIIHCDLHKYFRQRPILIFQSYFQPPPVSDQQQPSTREEEVTKSLPSVAPPPPKKRLLATLKRENKLPGGKGVTFKEPLTETDT